MSELGREPPPCIPGLAADPGTPQSLVTVVHLISFTPCCNLLWCYGYLKGRILTSQSAVIELVLCYVNFFVSWHSLPVIIDAQYITDFCIHLGNCI